MRTFESDAKERIDWVDYAKGWCIVLVVMMHSTLGVGEAMGGESWLHDFVAWARPFRMPDFFLVAGLFLSRSIELDWSRYLDRKVVHFAYFYLLWMLIQGVPKLLVAEGGDPGALVSGLAYALVQPFGTLWFIYLLPIFFVVTKLLRRAPVEAVFLVAALAQMAQIETESIVVEEFAARYVYFYAGYAFAPHVFALADRARRHVGVSLALLLAWGVVNALAVRYGIAARPGFSLIFGFAGAAAVVVFSALLAQAQALPFLRALGSRSIVVYLAFFLPMAAARVLLVKSGLIADVGLVSALVTVTAVVVPLILHALARDGRLRFLFERPLWARLPIIERRVARRGLSGAGANP